MNTIKLYTKENCPKCDEVKVLLAGKDIQVIDVNKDAIAYADMIVNDVEELPVLVSNGRFETNMDSIKNLLRVAVGVE
jgi:glutaredoxin